MGERLLCKQEVIGSNPFTSTIRGTIRGHHPAFGEDLERSRSGVTRRGARCLKGEERVCHVTEADAPGAKLVPAKAGGAGCVRRSVFM